MVWYWYEADLQAIDAPEILYDLIEGGLKACMIRHVAPTQANPLFSIFNP